MVLLASNHFRGSIAGAPTSSLQSLSELIHIAEAEVHYFYVFVFVQEQVFRLEVSVADLELVKVLYP